MTKFIPVNKIVPNPEQPRTHFDQNELDVLARSIEENSLLVPITVEKTGDSYVLIDGERRWRAVQMLGWQTIEASIRPAGDREGQQRLLHALVANVQRIGNTPTEEGRAYQKLMQLFGTQEEVAQKVGVSTATISMRLALLEFPLDIQGLFDHKLLPLDDGMISALKKLPDDLCRKVSMTAARLGGKAQSVKRMCRTILLDGKPAYSPGVRRRIEKTVVAGHFDALHFDEFLISEADQLAVRETCAACALYFTASPSSCRECPLVDFLRRWSTRIAMEVE
jgi:ParB/RepB/Spo0J family partition protein